MRAALGRDPPPPQKLRGRADHSEIRAGRQEYATWMIILNGIWSRATAADGKVEVKVRLPSRSSPGNGSMVNVCAAERHKYADVVEGRHFPVTLKLFLSLLHL